MSAVVRILGIDPGSLITGYGLVDSDGRETHYVGSGRVRLSGGDHPQRLRQIFRDVAELIARYQPAELAIERVFVSKNAGSALKLGQARAAAICASFVGTGAEIAVHEYAPRQIKNAVAGYGGADKQQVQQMVVRMLSLEAVPSTDAADALAVAICHAHMRRNQALLASADPAAGGGK